MKNADMPSIPYTWYDVNSGGDVVPREVYSGLTKREDFAKFALKGLLVNAGRNGLEFKDCAAEAVRQADLLLIALEASK